MSAPNGHAQKDRAPAPGPPPAMLAPAVLQVPAERVKEIVAALEVPFDPLQIEWRVMNTTKGHPKGDEGVLIVQGQADDRESAVVFVLFRIRKARKRLHKGFDRAAMSRKRKDGPSETPRCADRWRDSL